MTELMTVRLKLRQWRAADLEPFASLNADPAVIEFLSRCLTRAESDEFAERVRSELAQRGWGLWAVEVREQGEFIGFVGLSEPSFEAHFTPCTEIGWRLARSSWGRGYATEAARACLDFAFRSLGLSEVVAFTVPANARSRAVMERLGMRARVRDRLRHRGRPSVPRFRLPESRALRGGRLHRARERALAGRDGAARHASARARSVTPPRPPERASISPSGVSGSPRWSPSPCPRTRARGP